MSLYVCLFIILVSMMGLHAQVSDTGSFDNMDSMRHRDRFNHLHELYSQSSGSRSAKEIHQTVTNMAYVDSRVELIGLLLFGPRKGRSILRSVRDGESSLLVDDEKCLKSTVMLFRKHCVFFVEHDSKHIQAFSNMCKYVVHKAAIEDAFMVACGIDNLEPTVAASMKSYVLICLFIILVSMMGLHAQLSDTGSFDSIDSMRHRDRFNELYTQSLGSRRSRSAKEIHHTVTNMAYVDSRVELIGLLLFGPRKGWSILRSVRDGESSLVDDVNCLKSMVTLFRKHCGFFVEHDSKHIQSFSNMCRYVVHKAAIEDAFMIACGIDNLEPAVIDLENPVSYATPTPVRGSSYCDRVSVRGIAGMSLQSYHKAYQVSLLPSSVIPRIWRKKIQICFHRNASLRWCGCEKDDWISLQHGSWATLMSPYEQMFVDVKFHNGVYGFVRITLKEVSQKWRCVLLIAGTILVFMAPDASRHTFVGDNYVTAQLTKWGMRIFGGSFIFMSSIDTTMATMAVLCVLSTNAVIILEYKSYFLTI